MLDALLVAGMDSGGAAQELQLAEGTTLDVLTDIRKTAMAVECRSRCSRNVIEAYRREIHIQAQDPVTEFVAIDVTGDPTGFFNWVTDPFFEEVLNETGRYSDSRRARNCRRAAAVRCFVVSEERLSLDYIQNVLCVARAHLVRGILVAIAFRRQCAAPSEVACDLASFGNKCADFGHLEFHPTSGVGHQDILIDRNEPRAFAVRERIGWLRDNWSRLVHVSDIAELPTLRAELLNQAGLSIVDLDPPKHMA